MFLANRLEMLANRMWLNRHGFCQQFDKLNRKPLEGDKNSSCCSLTEPTLASWVNHFRRVIDSRSCVEANVAFTRKFLS